MAFVFIIISSISHPFFYVIIITKSYL